MTFEWALIFLLLGTCRPAAISRLVITVVIDSINRMSIRRRMSHVTKKGGKLCPFRRNLYSSATVIFIFSIFAAIVNSAPSSIRFCMRKAAIFITRLNENFLPVATTGSRMTTYQVASMGFNLGAACAHAKKDILFRCEYLIPFFVKKFVFINSENAFYEKSAKVLSGQIVGHFFRHSIGHRGHSILWFKQTGKRALRIQALIKSCEGATA